MNIFIKAIPRVQSNYLLQSSDRLVVSCILFAFGVYERFMVLILTTVANSQSAEYMFSIDRRNKLKIIEIQMKNRTPNFGACIIHLYNLIVLYVVCTQTANGEHCNHFHSFMDHKVKRMQQNYRYNDSKLHIAYIIIFIVFFLLFRFLWIYSSFSVLHTCFAWSGAKRQKEKKQHQTAFEIIRN